MRIRIGKTHRARASEATFNYAYASGRGDDREVIADFQIHDGRRLTIRMHPTEARTLCAMLGRFTGNGGDA